MKELLELRKKMKAKRPKFIRQDAHKKRLRKRWVKPRGLHSKVRLKHKGHARKVSDGYRCPKEIRGLSKEGLKIMIVHNMNELEKINKEKEGVIISSTVGLKNKILLLNKTKELGIKVLNLNVDNYLKKEEEKTKKKLENKKIREEKKETKKKEEKKETEKDEKLEEKLSDDEKKEAEKKEKDKLLTKREV